MNDRSTRTGCPRISGRGTYDSSRMIAFLGRGNLLHMTLNGTPLPLVYAGPILRRLEPKRMVVWMAVREPLRVRLRLQHSHQATSQEILLSPNETGSCRCLSAGTHLHFLLIDLQLETPLPHDTWIEYELAVQTVQDPNAAWHSSSDTGEEICYGDRSFPGFMLPSRVGSLLHGSCRKPHHHGGDGLVAADRLLQSILASEQGTAAPNGESPLNTNRCATGLPHCPYPETRSMRTRLPDRCYTRYTRSSHYSAFLTNH